MMRGLTGLKLAINKAVTPSDGCKMIKELKVNFIRGKI